MRMTGPSETVALYNWPHTGLRAWPERELT